MVERTRLRGNRVQSRVDAEDGGPCVLQGAITEIFSKDLFTLSTDSSLSWKINLFMPRWLGIASVKSNFCQVLELLVLDVFFLRSL